MLFLREADFGEERTLYIYISSALTFSKSLYTDFIRIAEVLNTKIVLYLLFSSQFYVLDGFIGCRVYS